MNAAGPTKGVLLRPSDQEHPHEIVFIQCVGSRDVSGCGKPYCSKICCDVYSETAMLIQGKYQTRKSMYLHRSSDPWKDFDEFYRRALKNTVWLY